MAYGRVWTFDPQRGQYYRMDGTRKVYYDDAVKGDANTCYATYLAKGQPGKCPRIIECIIDGNSTSLSRCLDIIGDVDLWKVAEDDVNKVAPDMVRLVLRKFGVSGDEEPDGNGGNYVVPITYDEWMNEVVETLPQKVKTVIKSNTKLLTYLKGLISVCRANPSILNKNNPQVVTRENIPVLMQNLNMRKYYVPSANKKTQYEFFAESLRNATWPRFVNNDLWNPIISGSMSNVNFFSPYTTSAPAQMGGHFYAAVTPSLQSRGTSSSSIDRQTGFLKNGSSSIFYGLFSSITNAMNDVGLTLHSDDIARLKEAIRQLEKYEDQLARMCIALNNLVKLARFYGVSLENVDREHPTVVKLTNIHNWDDIRAFIRRYVKDIVKNMSTNMSLQQSTAYELMNKISPRFLDDCSGKPQDNTPTVTGRAHVPL